MQHTKIYYAWREPTAADGFRSGVSLHSHTSHSRESLEFIPKYARRSSLLAKVMALAEWQYRQRTGKPLDCGRAYWTPPLSPQMALELEATQIRKNLRLPAIISLTDHDTCEAGLETDTPVSIEWTIPFAPSFFHLGIHNVPRAAAHSLSAEMNAFTAAPNPARLLELLVCLDSCDDSLVVLNHPLWDEGLVGEAAHRELLRKFLTQNGQRIHALELNGLRSASENELVCHLATEFDFPVVSGGDRHGREPNANLNLSHAESFTGFVDEIRRDKRSNIIYMPHYREPLRMRQFETAWDILRYDQKRVDGRNSWCDRVYFTTEEGVTRPISFYFGETGPKILMPFLAAMRLLEQPAIRPMLKAALSD